MSFAPTARGVVGDAPVSTAYPVRYDVPSAGRQSRWRVALRLLLVLPHLVALYLCFYLAELITFAAWLIGVFSGHYEPGLAALPIACLRWEARVLTYVGLLRDEYPSFFGGAYPMQFDVTVQLRQSRASILFRALLVLPQFIVVNLLWTVWIASVALAWFALLITGRYPEGLRRLVIGLNRWLLRVVAYTLLLRGDYPPFSLGMDEQAVPPPFAATVPVFYPPSLPAALSLDTAPPPPPPTVYVPLAPAHDEMPPTVPVPPPSPMLWTRETIMPSSVAFPAEIDRAAPIGGDSGDSDEAPAQGPTFFRQRRDPPQS